MVTFQNQNVHFPFAEDRIWPRLKCDFITECSAFGVRWVCNIVDLSQRGLGIVSSAKLYKGDTVDISEPRTKAQVVWVEKGRVGLKVLN
jgi:hypothetical protein